jgi:adenylate kinase
MRDKSYKMKDTIFIAGVHGVGKTYYTNILVNKYKCFNRVSASSLIKYDVDVSKTTKKVIDIDYNQNVMIRNFLKLRDNTEAILLFDGHFVLIDNKNEICEISTDVFNSLNFNEIILFIDNIENIYNRLVKRDNNSDLNLLELSKMQEREILRAKFVSNLLNISLNIINLENKKDKEILINLENILVKYLK